MNDSDYTPDAEEQAFMSICENPFVSNAFCSFAIDGDGMLRDNILSADITGKDSDGKSHTLTFYVHFKGDDYGTTAPMIPDFKGETVYKASDEMRSRLKELEVLINNETDENSREAYKREYDSKKSILARFDEGKPMTEDEYWEVYEDAEDYWDSAWN